MVQKKILSLLIVFFFILTSIFSADIVVKAEGNSLEQARNNAYSNLASSFGSKVSSTTYTQTVDDGESSIDIMSEEITVKSENEFPFVQVDTVKEGRKYIATLTIPVSAVETYIDKLNQIVEQVNYYRNEYDSLTTNKDRLFNLDGQIKGFTLYTSYRAILTMLGTDISTLSVLSGSSFGIEKQYNTVLNDYKTDLNAEAQAYQSGFISASTKEAKAELERIAKEQETVQKIINQKAAEDKQKQEAALAKANAESSRAVQDLQALAEKNRKVLADKNLDSFTAEQLIKDIESNKKEFVTLNNTLELKINENTIRLVAERDKAITDIKNRQYRSAELSGNMPTERALTQRQKEIDEVTKKYASLIDETEKNLRKSIDKQLKDYQKQINKQIKELEKKTFKLNSVSNPNNLIIYTDNYEGSAGGWAYAIYAKFITSDIFINGFITYDKLTGKSYNINNKKQYEEYLYAIDTYDLYLLGGNALQADIEYSIEADKNQNSTYNFYVNSIKITRLDNGDIIYSETGSNLYSTKYISTPQYDIRTLDQKETDEKIEITKKSVGNILETSDIFVLPMWAYTVYTDAPINNTLFSQFGLDLEYLYKINGLQFGAGTSLIFDFKNLNISNLVDAIDVNLYAAAGYRTSLIYDSYAYLNILGGYNVTKNSFLAGFETMMNNPLGSIELGFKLSLLFNFKDSRTVAGFGIGLIF